MVKFVLILGAVFAAVALFVTAILGISDSDKYGRVKMPGERGLRLEAGEYGLYYEERVETGENETFEAPDGIRIRVRGLRGAPDPEVDLGGLGSQVGTDDFTAETIGTLKVEQTGRYGLVVGRPPQPAIKPAITVGKKGSAAFIEGGKRALYVLLVTGALAGLLLLVRRVRGDRGPEPSLPPMPAPISRAPAATATPAVTAVPATGPSGPSTLDELERLAELRRSGALSEDEFERRKRELLA